MSQEPLETTSRPEEEEYDEEADEDFVLEDAAQKGGEEDDSWDEEASKSDVRYANIASDAGGLVKTRHQRAQEAASATRASTVNKTDSSKSKSDINLIWAELNNKGTKAVSSNPVEPSATITEQQAPKKVTQVKISRTYEFAGETIREEKMVDADSEEAKAHLNSTKLAQKQQDCSDKPPVSTLRRKRKRASLLDAVITNSSKAKLSTLEKSRLDWASYVDKNKIGEELKYKNKNGYLEKQDFLSRVDSKQDEMRRGK